MIFIASAIALAIFRRFDHPAVPGYILAGALLNTLILHSQLLELAQLGVIFIVFFFGLKLEPKKLKDTANQGLWTGITVALLVGALAYLMAVSIGLDVQNALYFSLAASLSSSLVGLELIDETLGMELLHGRLAESIHLVQDALAAGFLVAISALSRNSPVYGAMLGIAIFVAALTSRTFLPELISSRSDDRELSLLSAIAILTGFIAFSELAQIPPVIGSFAAGLALAKFPYSAETFESVKPVKDFFSVVFFVSLGSLITLPSIQVIALTAVLLLFTMVLKPLLTAFHLIESGYDHRSSYLAGLSLDQVSEFALVVAISGFTSGVVQKPVFESIVIASAVSMVASSYTNSHSSRIYTKLATLGVRGDRREREKLIEVDDSLEDHVVVAGFGQKGSRISRILEKEGEAVLPIDNDPEKITEAEHDFENYLYGDAVREKVWKRARAGEAKVIISTVEDSVISDTVLGLDSDSTVILSADSSSEAAELMEKGADLVDFPGSLDAERLEDHVRSVLADPNHAEELRRKKMLEMRRQSFDGFE